MLVSNQMNFALALRLILLSFEKKKRGNLIQFLDKIFDLISTDKLEIHRPIRNISKLFSRNFCLPFPFKNFCLFKKFQSQKEWNKSCFFLYYCFCFVCQKSKFQVWKINEIAEKKNINLISIKIYGEKPYKFAELGWKNYCI